MTQQPVKRLYRSRTQRMLGGVLGGFAEYASLDPTVVRLVFVLLTILTMGFLGVIVYIAALLIVPEEPAPTYGAPPVAAYPTPPPPPPPQ